MWLAGCATTQGQPGSTGLQPFKLDTSVFKLEASNITDAFSTQMRGLKNLVAESKYAEADAFFIKEQEYFSNRLQGENKDIPQAVQQLAEHVWTTRYRPIAREALAPLQAVTSVADRSTWPAVNKALKQANQLEDATANDMLLSVTKVGSADRDALKRQVARVTELANANKRAALAATFEPTLSSGKHDAAYIGQDKFVAGDYVQSAEFQSSAMQRVKAVSSTAEYFKEATRLAPYLSEQSKASLDTGYAELVRKGFLADGQVSLDEVATLGGVHTPFGGAKDLLSKMVKIGYVDLTSASFKDRNVFDFEIAFKQDLGLEFAPASESVFSSADIAQFDFLFVTDLTVAKVSRRFKAKKGVKSRAQSGTREVQNPNYISALTNYQRAMTEFQRTQIKSAIPQACQGWVCVIQGIASGLEQGSARNGVDQASTVLAGTSQTLSEPVYSEYTYQSVDIDTSKTADVNYYVIDVKNKRILKSNFQVNDNEVFNVAYNVRDEDPAKASILRNTKPEEEVTAWEKRPVSVGLSSLFSEKNLRSATQTPYASLQAFLETLSTRVYASAAPTYSRGSEPVSRQASSQTVADERFDSVVIVRNAKATGTGFYVTPDLLLTAYHVVDGSSLVELTFYDGTKSYGRVVDHDVRLDLALIKAQNPGKPLKIHSGPIKLGETVEAIGHPKGYDFTITRGVVSALRKQRSAAIGSNNLVEYVQTDTPISPGNSGGPLLLKDAVVGVNDWIRVDKGSQNLNFSVSFNEIREYLDRFSGK
jgi:S1-C subfamily serine protease